MANEKANLSIGGKVLPVTLVDQGDGSYAIEHAADMLGWDATTLTPSKLLVDHATGALLVTSTGGSSGGGGPVTIADGGDVAQGATTDTAAASTAIGILKAIKAAVQGTLTVAGSLGRSWTLASGTDSVNVGNFPATQPVSGTVSLPGSTAGAQSTSAKGTQGSAFVPTQDAKDAGRTAVTLFLDAVAGVTSEALGTMSINKGGVAQSAATSYTVTAGKTLRISGLHTSVKNTSAVASDSRTRVRQAASSFSVASPIILVNEAGSPAAVANAVGTDDTVMPDGYEIAGGQIIGISHVESATTCTVSVMLVGYEY